MTEPGPACRLAPGGAFANRVPPSDHDVRAADTLVEALARRQAPADSADPVVRLLAALVDDVDLDDVDRRGDDADQRRSSVSMTPST